MFLSGVKYQLTADSQIAAFRFRRSESGHRYLLSHSGGGSPRHLTAALEFAFGGGESRDVASALVQFTDDNGDHWTLDRSKDQFTISKNRQALTSESGLRELQQVLNGDPEIALSESIAHFDLTGHDANISAKRKDVRLRRQDRFNLFAEAQAEDYLNKCVQFLGLPQSISQVSLSDFVQSARQLTDEHRILEQQLQEVISSQYDPADDFDDSSLKTLANELKLLDMLDQEASFFNDPSHSFAVIKEKLLSTEQQLQKLCEGNGIGALPSLDQEIDWSLVIHCLSRLQVYQKLELAYRRSQIDIDGYVKPVFAKHIKQAKSFLLADKSLLDTIQTSLSFITNRLEELSEPAPAVPKLGLLRKIFDDKHSAEPLAQQIDPQMLANSRAHVDQILGSINQMCLRLEKGGEDYSRQFDEIHDRYEKIVQELGKAKAKWQQCAEHYHLDPDLTLKGILSLIQNLGRISTLYLAKKDLVEKKQDYLTRVERCRRRVDEWRLLTKSQNSSDISQPSILLGETRALLRLKEQKKQQYEKQMKLSHRNNFYRGLRSELVRKQGRLGSSWTRLFKLVGGVPRDIDGAKWEQFFVWAAKAKACLELVAKSRKPLKGGLIFSDEQIDQALTVFYVDSAFDTASQIELFRLIDFHQPRANLLFVYQSVELKQRFEKAGFGISEPVKMRAPAAAANVSSEQSNKPATPRDPVMSEKAKAALELFKSRNVTI